MSIGRIEFLDEKAVDINNAYSKLALDVTPTLFLEFSGDKATIEHQVQIAS